MSTDVIVTTGPESSGKSTLASQLADYWHAPLVPEIARDYLSGCAAYQQHDLLEIAKQQYQKEQLVLSRSPEKVICDTDLLVIMVWGEVKYGQCDSWIYSKFEDSVKRESCSRHYYLCDFHIPWQADPLRENPHNRDELFNIYQKKLEEFGLDYSIVKGNSDERLQQVINDFDS